MTSCRTPPLRVIQARRTPRPWLMGLGLAAAALGAGPARADGATMAASAMPPLYRSECAACHLAYPPGLLPAASWQRLLDNLPRHFGADASLDAASTLELSKWLQANAGTYKKLQLSPAAPPEDRITRSAWFTREHGEIGRDVWRLPAVAGAFNCWACHTQTAQGRFSEHDVRIPK